MLQSSLRLNMLKTLTATLFALTIGVISPMIPLLSTAAIAQMPSHPISERIRTKKVLELLENGNRETKAGQLNAAIKTFEQALQISRQQGEIEGQLLALAGIGNAYNLLKQYDQARSYYDQTTALASEHQRVLQLFVDGSKESQAGRLDAAITIFEQMIKISRQHGNVEGELLAQLGIANAYTKLGQYDRAANYYQQALEIARKYQLRQHEAMTLGDSAQSLFMTGEYKKALALQLQVLQLERELNDKVGEVLTLNDLGNLYVNLGNDRKAETYFREGLAVAKQVKRPSLEATILSNLGALSRRAENYEQSRQFQQQALTLYRSLNDPMGEITALGNLGNLSASLKKYDEALRFYEESLQLARKSQISAPLALINIAGVYWQMGNSTKAIEIGQQGLAIATQTNNRPYQGIALTGLSEVYLRTGKLSEAEAAIQQAIPILDNLRLGLNDSDKITLLESQSRIDRLSQEILIQQNRPEAALEAAERGRARAFVELLASRRQTKSQAEIQALALAPKIQKIRQIAQAQNATLVEYSIVSEKLLYIWVIKPNGEVIFRSTPIDPAQPLKRLVARGRNEIGVRGRVPIQKVATQASTEAIQGNLRKLHQLLIEPIAQDLPTDSNQQVIFLPQGELFLVPFAALPNAQGQHLIEKHTLSTAPSIQTLEFTQALAKQPKSQSDVVIIGDPKMPEFDGSQLEPLPGARQEAISIGKLLKTTPILGEQATKPFVLKQIQSAKILHFATHGLLDTIQGDIPGAIALAPSGNDSGLLSSSEIFNLKLNADLVVLSACDTGQGKITGDGVVGLSRSFVAAGAPSVLVSLWAVDDGSTSELMGEFYRQLQTQPNKAQALRQAMLKIRKQQPDPFHWAAFTLIGETQ
jgi:CHAT domain-containing protein/Tfp pilus assembly protein PilF